MQNNFRSWDAFPFSIPDFILLYFDAPFEDMLMRYTSFAFLPLFFSSSSAYCPSISLSHCMCVCVCVCVVLFPSDSRILVHLVLHITTRYGFTSPKLNLFWSKFNVSLRVFLCVRVPVHWCSSCFQVRLLSARHEYRQKKLKVLVFFGHNWKKFKLKNRERNKTLE